MLDLLGNEIARDQNDLQIAVSLRRNACQFDPCHIGHADVGDHHAEVGGGCKKFQGLRAAAGLQDAVAEILQELGNYDADFWIVVNDHQLRLICRCRIGRFFVAPSVRSTVTSPLIKTELSFPRQFTLHGNTRMECNGERHQHYMP